MPENNEVLKKEGEELKDSANSKKKEVKARKAAKRGAKKTKRKIKKSTVRKISAIFILIAVLAVVLYFAFKTLKLEKPVASVNGELITDAELEQKYSQLPDQYKLFITKDAFLDQMINVKLLLQESRKQGIVVNEQEINLELDTLKKQAPTEEAFEGLLKQRNINLDGLRKQINEQLTINKLLNQTVTSKIDVGDSKIESYYNAHAKEFEAKEGEIRASHILVSAKEEAEQLLQDLKKEEFSKLAKAKSIDTISAERGGDLGFISKGQMVKEFEDAAFALNVNQASQIIKTQFGYHIIKREPDKIPYAEAKEQIRSILLNEIFNTAIEIYINQLRSNAEIINEWAKITSKETEITPNKETFTETGESICREGGKAVVRLFSTTKNQRSEWVSESFDEVMGEYGDIVAYHWQLDTGDNTLTKTKENGIPKGEIEIFQKYNPKSTVPTYIFGCKYARVGNAYSSLEEEKAEFRQVIEKLIILEDGKGTERKA